MVWEEGGGIGNSRQGMITNLQAYRCPDNLGAGATTNLHGNLGGQKQTSILAESSRQ